MQEPLASIVAPGVHAYAEKSVEAGGVINFRISSDTPGGAYQLSVLRPGLDLNGKQLANPVPITGIPTFEGHFVSQSVTPGSYVNVDKALPATESLSAITLECWVRPSQFNANADPEQWWGLISQYSHPTQCGFGMFLGNMGSVAIYFGDGGTFDGELLFECTHALASSTFTWAHVVAVWDGAHASLWINAELQNSWPMKGPVTPGAAPLRLAAYGENGQTAHILEGDLAMPIIYGRALSPAEIKQRFEVQGLPPTALDNVLACWPLTEEKGQSLADIGPDKRTGTLINQGTWMIGGPRFHAAAVPRLGEYDPAQDPTRGHGLRFASDDLFDAGWSISATLNLPADLKPGIYVGQILYGPSLQSSYDVTFVVTKPESQPKARMVVLCATNTWLAYACTPFVANYTGTTPPIWGNDGRYDNDAGVRTAPPIPTPGFNCYSDHLAGQPTYLLGLNLPWPAANPDVRYFGNVDYSHLSRAELFTHVWLDQNDYDYDVITDFDLNNNPKILDDYKVLLIAGHSEYWSVPAYQAVEGFLRAGNDVICLSGNTMFWRVSFDPDFQIMQCRKARYFPGGRYYANTGETWHSGEAQRGGLMRECNHPTWRLLGMESAGLWNATVLEDYTCDLPTHALFQSPNKIVIPEGTPLAAQAVGHEWDVTVALPQQSNVGYPGPQPPGQQYSTLFQPDWPGRVQTLGHGAAFFDAVDTNPTNDSQQSYTIWDYFIREADSTNAINSATLYGSLRSSEIIYWERTSGGRVFYAGSIAAGRALWGGTSQAGTTYTNKPWQDLLRNVLAKFGVNPRGTAMS